jgi:hypothetical protein
MRTARTKNRYGVPFMRPGAVFRMSYSKNRISSIVRNLIKHQCNFLALRVPEI